ncbi:DUF5320 domain-containing protein [Candidatus Woesearchaeota archaeon]|nr:DUF5320 domain-containing protein [Candidatus Woesearchaeota archaeon]
MPAQDGTGPMGRGPMTGRGMGPCGAGMQRGSGFGRGMRGGRGWFCRFPFIEPVALTQEEQKKVLEAEKEELEFELKRIKEKLDEING